MKIQFSIGILIISILGSAIAIAQPATEQSATSITPAFYAFAPTPPMGWNSYDAFGDSVTEDEVLANAKYMRDHLLSHGWNIVVVDFRWYDPSPTGDDHTLNKKRTGAKLAADPFGRLLPAPNRFPSAGVNGESGFKPLADKLHAMGLKFGIHYMRGIPRQAVISKIAIADSNFTAADAGNTRSICAWCPDMYGVQNNDAGQAWYDAMFKLYASWGLDYIKVDDLSLPYASTEIDQIRKAIDKCGRQIIFSTSPGPTSVHHAQHIQFNSNLWRISGDFWDTWTKLDQQFDLLYIWRGTGGLGHWPDADMIPFGHICIRSKAGGDDRLCRYTRDEQIMLISLWSLAPSPLMLGGNLPDNTAWDLSLLSNDEILAINQDPLGKQAVRVSQQVVSANRIEVWLKELKNGYYAAGLFNRGNVQADVSLIWKDAKLTGKFNARDLWQHKDLGEYENQFSLPVPPHGSVLLKLSPAFN